MRAFVLLFVISFVPPLVRLRLRARSFVHKSVPLSIIFFLFIRLVDLNQLLILYLNKEIDTYHFKPYLDYYYYYYQQTNRSVAF